MESAVARAAGHFAAEGVSRYARNRGPQGVSSDFYDAANAAYRYARDAYKSWKKNRKAKESYKRHAARAMDPSTGPATFHLSNDYHRKKHKKLKSKFKILKEDVKELKKNMPKQSKLVNRALKTAQFSCAVNTRQVFASTFELTSSILSSILNNCPIWNPAADAERNGSFSASANVHSHIPLSIFSKLRLKNNCTAVGKIFVYCVTPKDDNSTAPATWITNGFKYLTGAVPSTGTGTLPSVMWSVYDIPDFMQYWHIAKSHSKFMAPGEELELSFGFDGQYDHVMATVEDAETYQRDFSYSWFVILEGDIAHDGTTTSNVGLGQCTIDAVEERTVMVKYPDSNPKKWFITTNSASSITTPVQAEVTTSAQDYVVT